MIIFGIGLGYHLSHLLEDVTIDHLYLCEPNNDWFYAITQGIKKTLWYGMINPLNVFLKGLPWWYTTLVFAAGAQPFLE